MEHGKDSSTAAFLQCQLARYPESELQDLLKALRQSALGCVCLDPASGMERLRAELAPPPRRRDVEPLDGPFVRVHLGYLGETGLAPETLLRCLALSDAPGDGTARLEEKLEAALDLSQAGRLPWPREETASAVSSWRRSGFPVLRHSPRYRKAYAPAYRVLGGRFGWALPLLAAIDRRLAARGRVLLAIDGGSASGKTSLAELLARIYGCSVYHMDDFFLRPEQRTEERLSEPGGNVDRERFLEEVLLPLRRGGTVRFRRYDCHADTLSAPVQVPPGRLEVVEGAYSLHPDLMGYYDLTAFLRIGPELQRRRILERNGPEAGARFFSRWIPLEERYFAACAPALRCGVLLDAQPPAG